MRNGRWRSSGPVDRIVLMRLRLLLLIVVLAACGADGGEDRTGTTMSSSDGDPVLAEGATSCEELAASTPLAPDATNPLGIRPGGRPLVCSLDFRSDAPALTQLGIKSYCPPEAAISVPFVQVPGGWRLDRQQLAVIDNAECLRPSG